jgi:hypothetical protein
MNKYNYIEKPNSVQISEIKDKDFILSPSRYKQISIVNPDYKFLLQIISPSKQTINVENHTGYYLYTEIGDINYSTGSTSGSLLRSINISTNSLYKLKKNDILISTVRTYLGGIGFVSEELKNHICTKALIVLRDLIDQNISKYYLFGVMRSSFFIQQTNLILNASMYPRMDKNSLSSLIIPFPTKANNPEPEKVQELVSLIVQNIIDKEQKIKLKNKKIDEFIERELKNNQKENSDFKYSYPRISEIKKKARLDTGLYTPEYKQVKSLIEGYKNGCFQIPLESIKSGNTPEIRLFSEKGKYRWVTPTDITDEGFYSPIERISFVGNHNIHKPSLLIINRTSRGKKGEYVGISAFYNPTDYGIGHHNQGIYRVDSFSISKLLFLTAVMNSRFYRIMCGCISFGSKMKEIKSEDFSKILFPNFADSRQEEIAKEYYNPLPKYENLSLNNYLEKEKERNNNVGIFQLNMELFELRDKLEEIIHKIVMNETVELNCNS